MNFYKTANLTHQQLYMKFWYLKPANDFSEW